PASVTATVGWNVAVTASAWLTVTVHVDAEPEQSPLKPVNDDPGVGVAVKVTNPASPALHAVCPLPPQSIPAGYELTFPDPAPASVTDNVFVGGGIAPIAIPAGEVPTFMLPAGYVA